MNEVVFDILEAMEWRVVGGTISTRAETRSKKVSFIECSESTDESETEEEVLEEDGEP